MFFKNKKKEEKKELLYRENIRVNCKAATQEEVIRSVGGMLVNSGYVEEPYVEAMLGNKVNVVIGIAGVGEEHLEILSVIAEKMLDDAAAKRLLEGGVDEVYEILARKE